MIAMTSSFIREIDDLQVAGFLGPEGLPEPDYWRWPVLKPDELTGRCKQSFEKYGEVRWYGDDSV